MLDGEEIKAFGLHRDILNHEREGIHLVLCHYVLNDSEGKITVVGSVASGVSACFYLYHC